MDASKIIAQIKCMDITDLSPEIAIEIYAYTLAAASERLTEDDIRRLILLFATMYRCCMKNTGTELQITNVTRREDFSEEQLKMLQRFKH